MGDRLRELPVGSKAEVIGYEAGSAQYRKKLLSMGLTRGTEISLTKIAPLGDPVEIKVRGFRLSLRKEEADALLLRSEG